MTWIAVAAGGALGSLARYGVGYLLRATSRLPVGTAVVNLSGCFGIGLLAGLAASERLSLRPATRDFLFAGLLGGVTTFSSFGLETLMLSRGGSPAQAALNVGLQVAGGLAAVWFGYQFGARST